MAREPATYIVASGFHGTIYTGVTSNLLQRIHQHREGTLRGFTAEYGCKRLVWFEMHATMPARSPAKSSSRTGTGTGRWR
jgi:putative endonuclease